ncbi:PAC2 family protein [Georgenia wangjunii]|uniref:PAC2 family protein n=1 Tax=Georgenia wangjunii TaxID=3117730 RepID=UPI002F25F052
MTDSDHSSPLGSPQQDPDIAGPAPAILLAAFEGWNDAGGAASQAVAMIAEAWDATVIHELDPQEFHDFQVNRPIVGRDDDGNRVLTWPSTTISVARTPVAGRTLLLVQGIEPSFRWLDYCEEILDVAQTWEVGSVVAVGALLADVPHTRPIPSQVTSDDPRVQALIGAGDSEYEGPSGIVGVLAHLAQDRDLHAMTLWAAVPHYVAQPPSPKATLALLTALEELIGEPAPLGDLAEDARAWQAGVDELAEQDPEVAEYVRQLEEVKDTAELPEASGEAIAREFERYLRRRDRGSGPTAGGKQT